MKHRRTKRFVTSFDALDRVIKQKVIKALRLVEADPSYPSLRIEKIEGYPGVWAGRVDYQHRFTFHFERDTETGERICVLRDVGTHDVYRNP